jgi:hypothetical protein
VKGALEKRCMDKPAMHHETVASAHQVRALLSATSKHRGSCVHRPKTSAGKTIGVDKEG